MKRAILVALAGCGSLKGFGEPTPLATLTVDVSGTPGKPLAHPHVALVWGEQWLTEPLCILPPENAQAAATLAAGCRDPFGFVPLRVETNVPIELGTPATIELFTLPGADALVGDLTARVAYGSFVLYDDGDANDLLELARPNRLGVPVEGPGAEMGPTMTTDTVWGGSFVTMTAPDQRLAYREGAFDEAAAFYPRNGCDDPPRAFSIDTASGFTVAEAIRATVNGMLPQEDDLSQCAQVATSDAVVEIPAAARTADVAELACTENNADSSVRYREPPDTQPNLTNRTSACVHLPSFGGPPSTVVEWIVSGRSDDACKGLTHYILKGCREGPDCGTPDWDHSLAPPSWWPCP